MQRYVHWLTVAVLPILVHCLAVAPAEPVFAGDSNRHVMTSVFFRDFLLDAQFASPKSYAEAYYEQYPALGLLIWPPLFHGVCGVFMIVFGTSATVPRLLIMASLVLASCSVFQLSRRALDRQLATLVTIVFSLLPLVFTYSRDVMLEMPTLALVLYSLERFDQWLRTARPFALYTAAVTAALAALTRFDAVVLLPSYLCLLLFANGWKKLCTWHVASATLTALIIVAPVYLVIMREVGDLHVRQAASSVGGSIDGGPSGFMLPGNFWFYPSVLIEQAGWTATICFAAGLLTLLNSRHRKDYAAFSALLLATYVTFTPLAELRSRHAIYWLPAVAFFAVVAVEKLCVTVNGLIDSRITASDRSTATRRMVLVSGCLYALLISSTAIAALREPAYRVEGYRAAAEYVLLHTAEGDRVLFDGWWDGNFTYHIRHLDSSRSRHVVRGDRLLYEFVCVPETDFQLHAETDRDILRLLLDVDPKLVIIENPQFYQTIDAAQQLRELIHAQPALFVPQTSIPVQSTLQYLKKFQLEVYRFNAVAVRQLLSETERSGDVSG